MILDIDPVGSPLLLLSPEGLNRWILINFYFRLISRTEFTFLEDSQE